MKITREMIALTIYIVGWTIVLLSMSIGGKEFSNEMIKILKEQLKIK